MERLSDNRLSVHRLMVHVDGAIAGMTNNEAEYHAALLGLELARELRAARVDILTDSEVVARQMSGTSRVNSPRLKGLHRQACAVAAEFDEVRFVCIAREENKLADALAAEALGGRLVAMPGLQHLERRGRLAGLLRRPGTAD